MGTDTFTKLQISRFDVYLKDLVSKEKKHILDVEGIVEYLSDQRYCTSAGILIRRYLQQWEYEETQNIFRKYPDIYDLNKIDHIETDSWDAPYVFPWPSKLIDELSAMLCEKCPGGPNMDSWAKWMKDNVTPKRDNIFIIGLALEMDVKTFNKMLYILEGETVNYRNPIELIYIYSMAHGYGLEDTTALINRYYEEENKASNEDALKKVSTGKTQVLESNDILIKDKDAFLAFLRENEREFFGYSKTNAALFAHLCKFIYPIKKKESATLSVYEQLLPKASDVVLLITQDVQRGTNRTDVARRYSFKKNTETNGLYNYSTHVNEVFNFVKAESNISPVKRSDILILCFYSFVQYGLYGCEWPEYGTAYKLNLLPRLKTYLPDMNTYTKHLINLENNLKKVFHMLQSAKNVDLKKTGTAFLQALTTAIENILTQNVCEEIYKLFEKIVAELKEDPLWKDLKTNNETEENAPRDLSRKKAQRKKIRKQAKQFSKTFQKNIQDVILKSDACQKFRIIRDTEVQKQASVLNEYVEKKDKRKRKALKTGEKLDYPSLAKLLLMIGELSGSKELNALIAKIVHQLDNYFKDIETDLINGLEKYRQKILADFSVLDALTFGGIRFGVLKQTLEGYETLDVSTYDHRERIEAFCKYTNDILAIFDFLPIYVPNAFDRLLLLSLVKESPDAFMTDIILGSVPTEELPWKITKNQRVILQEVYQKAKTYKPIFAYIAYAGYQNGYSVFETESELEDFFVLNLGRNLEEGEEGAIKKFYTKYVYKLKIPKVISKKEMQELIKNPQVTMLEKVKAVLAGLKRELSIIQIAEEIKGDEKVTIKIVEEVLVKHPDQFEKKEKFIFRKEYSVEIKKWLEKNEIIGDTT